MKWTLDLQFFSQEKTEEATPKKRRDTRQKGQVPKSNDVNTAIILFLVFALFYMYGGTIFNHLQALMTHTYIEYMQWDITKASVPAMLQEITIQSVIIILPVMLVAMVAGVAASLTQVGFLITGEPIKMKLEKINPLSGIKRIFSARALVELAKALLKITLVGGVVFAILWLSLDRLLFLSQKDVGDSFMEIARLTGLMGLIGSLLLLVLSLPDYIYQKHDHEKQIRMSKHDVKQEMKNMEGDPLIRGKRKQKQQEMAMGRMMEEVPKADVVITNPTHFAVALRYEEGAMGAPKVIAKGADHLARKIKEKAGEHSIPMVENKPLARALYAQSEIDDEIPEDLFKAVAEVLAYVYRIKRKNS